MNRIKQSISDLLDGHDLIVIDIGAAFGLPLNLSVLNDLATVCYFEPDPVAARKLEEALRESGHVKSRVFPVALSSSGGPRTLYVTNVPTGTSLLKPGSDFGLDFSAPDYFNPMREVTVHTCQLAAVLASEGLQRADAIKLDVQGAEFEILQSFEQELNCKTLAVEMEIGFPGGYIDQPGFAEIDKLMRNSGFQLFDLRLSSFDRHYKGDWSYYRRAIFHVSSSSNSITKRITETDAIYFRRSDLAVASGDPVTVRRLLVMLCVYGFFVDALDIIERARSTSIFSAEQCETCRRSVISWHCASRDVVFDSEWFGKLTVFVRRASRFLQKRLLGHHFYRWRD